MKRNAPIKRARSKPRRTTSPRCSVRGCKKPQRVLSYCPSHAMKRADAAFSRWVRDRDQCCTAALWGLFPDVACWGNLDAAHGHRRGLYGTRYDPHNVAALCKAHHSLVDHNAETHKQVWMERMAVAFDYDPADLRSMAMDRNVDRDTQIRRALEWLEEA